jgi:hypothetical protein
MKTRYGIYFDEGDQEYYLDVESVHNRGVLLTDARKAEYDAAVKAYKTWQKFLSCKYYGWRG